MLASCDAGPTVQLAGDEQPIMIGSRVRRNTTILTDTFICFDNTLVKAGKKPLKIAVGNIADYTGKTSDSEGAVITRGGSLMLFSALGAVDALFRRINPKVRLCYHGRDYRSEF